MEYRGRRKMTCVYNSARYRGWLRFVRRLNGVGCPPQSSPRQGSAVAYDNGPMTRGSLDGTADLLPVPSNLNKQKQKRCDTCLAEKPMTMLRPLSEIRR